MAPGHSKHAPDLKVVMFYPVFPPGGSRPLNETVVEGIFWLASQYAKVDKMGSGSGEFHVLVKFTNCTKKDTIDYLVEALTTKNRHVPLLPGQNMVGLTAVRSKHTDFPRSSTCWSRVAELNSSLEADWKTTLERHQLGMYSYLWGAQLEGTPGLIFDGCADLAQAGLRRPQPKQTPFVMCIKGLPLRMSAFELCLYVELHGDRVRVARRMCKEGHEDMALIQLAQGLSEEGAQRIMEKVQAQLRRSPDGNRITVAPSKQDDATRWLHKSMPCDGKNRVDGLPPSCWLTCTIPTQKGSLGKLWKRLKVCQVVDDHPVSSAAGCWVSLRFQSEKAAMQAAIRLLQLDCQVQFGNTVPSSAGQMSDPHGPHATADHRDAADYHGQYTAHHAGQQGFAQQGVTQPVDQQAGTWRQVMECTPQVPPTAWQAHGYYTDGSQTYVYDTSTGNMVPVPYPRPSAYTAPPDDQGSADGHGSGDATALGQTQNAAAPHDEIPYAEDPGIYC
eukprot:TRINITY_DN18081_c1_g1_i1.p1 TRINITY_DN18081_c1_g1~~TRINITY_DN18081_c1_g1_i1.p1  ORF type:complete len:532 (+),score=124.53 TRINITY_DN18081_c1_g1_i1:91-1596(+)